MPSGFTRSPKLLKGALIKLSEEFLGPVPNVIVFQYNPEQFSPSVANRASPRDTSNAGIACKYVQRVPGPSVEVINVTVEIGAPDQVERKKQLRKGLTS